MRGDGGAASLVTADTDVGGVGMRVRAHAPLVMGRRVDGREGGGEGNCCDRWGGGGLRRYSSFPVLESLPRPSVAADGSDRPARRDVRGSVGWQR